MHEMSLVRPIIDIVVGQAELEHAKKVTEVYITIGRGRDVVPQLFDELFAYLAKGTVAEGATLTIEYTPMMSRCSECGLVYPIDIRNRDTWVCPRCKSQEYSLYSGREFQVDRIKVADKCAQSA